MSRKRLKARDKVALKMSKDGAILRNLTSGEDIRVSKRSADFDLRGDNAESDSFSQSGKSSKTKRKHRHHSSRPNPAEQGAAATTEPQIAGENSDAPKQPENAAIPRITAADERQGARQDDCVSTNNNGGNGVAQQIITGGKPPHKQSRKYANYTPPSDPAPQSALKHETGESPLKTEQSSELQFTREEKPPKLSRKQKRRQQRQNSQNVPRREEAAPITDNADSPPRSITPIIPVADGVINQPETAPQSALKHDTPDNPRFEPQSAETPIAPPKRKPLAEFAAKSDTDIADTPPTDITGGGGQSEIVAPPKTADAPESSLKTDKPGKLKFTDGESESKVPSRGEVKQQKKYGKAQAKANQSVKKMETAKSKLPAKKKLRSERVFNEKTGRAKRRLYFESEVKPQGGHLKGALPLRPVKAVGNTALAFAHRKIYQAERENVGTEAAHKVEMTAEGITRSALRHHKTAPYKKVAKLERKVRKSSINAAYQKALAENPTLKSNPLSRAFQKRKIKKDYAKAAREAQKAAKRAKKAGGMVADAGKAVAGVIKRHPVAAAVIVLVLLLVFCLMSLIGALGSAGSGSLSGLLAASYLAEDADIDNAELAYTEWETDLQIQAANAETSHPGYDEYRYNVGDISHNPFELMAYLTAKYQNFTHAAVYADLQALFNEQYTLAFTPSAETRYADPTDANEDGDYEPYDWNILTVTLTARSFSDVAASHLGGDEAEHYALLMQTKGARQYLANPFGDMNWLPYVTSYYGYRIHPISGEKNYHKGVDIALPLGTPIQSGQDGTVTFAGYSGDYGNVVVIEDADGLVSKYAHCDTLAVTVGQTVKTGDVIATVGSTGESTGAHLHLEILKNGQYLNGLLFAETGSYTAAPTYGFAGEAMGDGSYAALIAEAERHLGKPYVFGASGPDAFDCSGLICFVYRNAGVYDFGRIGATSIYNRCNPVSTDEARPGDVVVFHSTYSTPNPITHIGIFVGYVNGRPMMLHSGSPCQYTYIDTPYWQQHFYGFARIPTE